MGVLVLFAIGAAIGLTIARLMPAELPGDRSGAAAAGAIGALPAAALFASVIARPRGGGRSQRSPRVERG